MKNTVCFLLFILGTSTQITSQKIPLSPKNNPANMSLIKQENSKMSWSMVKDSTEIQIGEIQTKIKKEKDNIYIITTVSMERQYSS